MYCVQNFCTSSNSNKPAIGDAVAAIANGPKNVLGTTPENSK